MTPRPASSSRRTSPVRPLLGNVWAALLHPRLFFSDFPHSTRARQQSALLAVTLLALSVWVALQPPAAPPSDDEQLPSEMPPPFDPGLPGSSEPIIMDSFAPGGLAPLPGEGLAEPGLDSQDGGATPNAADVAENWIKGLSAGLSIMIGWLLQAVLLAEVPLLRGQKPDLGFNLRLAVWSSLPLALLIVLQKLFVASGGTLGAPGLSGLVTSLPDYAEWSPLARQVLLSLASQTTIFGLWSVALLYQAARHSLGGGRWMALLVVGLWMASSVLLPLAQRLLEEKA